MTRCTWEPLATVNRDVSVHDLSPEVKRETALPSPTDSCPHKSNYRELPVQRINTSRFPFTKLPINALSQSLFFLNLLSAQQNTKAVSSCIKSRLKLCDKRLGNKSIPKEVTEIRWPKLLHKHLNMIVEKANSWCTYSPEIRWTHEQHFKRMLLTSIAVNDEAVTNYGRLMFRQTVWQRDEDDDDGVTTIEAWSKRHARQRKHNSERTTSQRSRYDNAMTTAWRRRATPRS